MPRYVIQNLTAEPIETWALTNLDSVDYIRFMQVLDSMGKMMDNLVADGTITQSREQDTVFVQAYNTNITVTTKITTEFPPFDVNNDFFNSVLTRYQNEFPDSLITVDS